jgi:hypothetical protein
MGIVGSGTVAPVWIWGPRVIEGTGICIERWTRGLQWFEVRVADWSSHCTLDFLALISHGNLRIQSEVPNSRNKPCIYKSFYSITTID